MQFKTQVEKDHYLTRTYLRADRWMNYWYQLDAILSLKPASVFEIGVGNRVVSDTLNKFCKSVTTLDIAFELKPDIVGLATEIPFKDNSFDGVLAAEVLEHLPWTTLSLALGENTRVAKKYAVITLPHSGYTFALVFKFPLIQRKWLFKIPHFWKRHVFNGEHYWELGKKGYSVSRVRSEFMKAGLCILHEGYSPDDPGHYRFVLEKHP